MTKFTQLELEEMGIDPATAARIIAEQNKPKKPRRLVYHGRFTPDEVKFIRYKFPLADLDRPGYARKGKG